MKKISAIIPTYNRANLISESIDSVMGQSKEVFEIIIVDDGSTDHTDEVLRRYKNDINYIKQKHNGPAAARNKGIQAATGDYIAFLDSDDLWLKDKMKMQLEFLQRHPEIEIVFGYMANFSDDENNEIPEIKRQDVDRYINKNSSFLENLFDCLIIDNIIPTPTVLMKKECVHKIGYFDENLMIGEDYEYWLRASRQCKFGFVNAVLTKRRRHDGNLINDWVQMNKSVIYVLERIKSWKPELSGHSLSLIENRLKGTYYDIASVYLKRSEYTKSYHYLKEGGPGNIYDIKWLLKYLASIIMSRVRKD